MIVAIDIDGTLVNENDEWSADVLRIAQTAHENGHTLRVWSGGGSDYAQTWANRLERLHGLPAESGGKTFYFAYDDYPDIAIDDMDLALWDQKDVKLIWVDPDGNIPNIKRALELVS